MATIVKKVVLKAPVLFFDEKIRLDYTVVEGPVTVEEVAYERMSDHKQFIFEEECPIAKSGDKFRVTICLYEKEGYEFEEKNGCAVCDVFLDDGTKLTPEVHEHKNGRTCCHFSYEPVIMKPIHRLVLESPVLKEKRELNFGFFDASNFVDVDSVSYERLSDHALFKQGDDIPRAKEGERYRICIYVRPRPGYAFKVENGRVICDAFISYAATMLSSMNVVVRDDGKLYPFYCDLSVLNETVFYSRTRQTPTEQSKLLSRVSMRKSREGFSRYVKQLDEILAADLASRKIEVPENFNSNSVVVGTGNPVNHSSERKTEVGNVVLNAPPKLKSGDKINFDYTVKSGPVKVEWVTYVRLRDEKYIINKREFPEVWMGEKYSVHVYLSPKEGYTFKESDGNAVCNVSLADGTKLTSKGTMFVDGGKTSWHFYYEISIDLVNPKGHLNLVNNSSSPVFYSLCTLNSDLSERDSFPLGIVMPNASRVYSLCRDVSPLYSYTVIGSAFCIKIRGVDGRRVKYDDVFSISSKSNDIVVFVASGTKKTLKLDVKK